MRFLKIPFYDFDTRSETKEIYMINIDKIISITLTNIYTDPSMIITERGEIGTLSIRSPEDIKRFILEI